MRILTSSVHPNITDTSASTFHRDACRAIVIKNGKILLLYTERYDDYSLPGGGVDKGESLAEAAVRELQEETGAQQVKLLGEFGVYHELRPWGRDGFELVNMHSYCYLCSIGDDLAEPQLEAYERQNNMQPRWMKIDEAIAHNQRTLDGSPKQGFSLIREIYLLKRIKQELAPQLHLPPN